MAKKSARSSFLNKVSKYGAREAFEAHKADETRFSGGASLPAGIEGGIAQLVDCKLDAYKRGDMTGEYFFYAAGVVKSPKTHDGIQIKGLRTQIMEPLCETPNRSRSTFEEHLDWVLNELRKLGVDTEEIDLEDLEATLEALKEEKPHFRFRTWQGEPTERYPNPRVNEDWRGVCEFDSDEDEDDVEEVEDDEEPEESEEEDSEESEEEDSDETTEDLSVLAKKADKGNDDAADKLTAAAIKAGIEQSTIDDTESWAEVVALIEGGSDDEEKSDDSSDVPEKGDVYNYKPAGKRKPIQCEVTAVFAGKETCNLKSLDNGKVYKGVAWKTLVADEIPF